MTTTKARVTRHYDVHLDENYYTVSAPPSGAIVGWVSRAHGAHARANGLSWKSYADGDNHVGARIKLHRTRAEAVARLKGLEAA